jgi:hypothetical protein
MMSMRRIAAGALFLPWLLLPGGGVQANECARVASGSYSADRTISGPDGTQYAKVYVSGNRKREEGTMEGRPEVRITEGPGRPMIVFNPVEMVGVRIPGRMPSGGQGAKVDRADLGGGMVQLTLFAPMNGQMQQISQMTCRVDGVLVEARHIQPNQDGSIRGTITVRDSNVVPGPQPASLFAAPAGLKFLR